MNIDPSLSPPFLTFCCSKETSNLERSSSLDTRRPFGETLTRSILHRFVCIKLRKRRREVS